MDKTIFVAGATGYLGKHVIRAFHAAGWRIHALARKEERLGDVRDLCHRVTIAEATSYEQLDGVMSDADVVFSSLGVSHIRRSPTIWDVDHAANLNVVKAAEAQGVKRFMFISIIHADSVREWLPVAEARERVVDYLTASSMDWTVIRPTSFFNDMGRFFDIARHGFCFVPGDGSGKVNPIHGADLARVVVQAASDPSMVGKAVEVGGPEVFTAREIGELAFKTLNTKGRFVPIPFSTLRCASTMAKPLSANASTFIRLLTLLDGRDAVAPVHGSSSLETFFEALAQTPSEAHT